MFKALLGFVLVLGSLLVLVPEPTTGFSVKLQGDDNSIGKNPLESIDSKKKVSMKDDIFPSPNVKSAKENVPTSDEVTLDKIAKSMTDGVDNKTKIPMKDDAFPDPNGKDNVPTSDDSLTKSLTVAQIDAFLIKYGYLNTPINGSVSEKERTNAVKEFQRFSRLSETGIVDTHTETHMKKSRCGLPDTVSSSKLAKFNAGGYDKWPKKHLTYKIAVFSKKLPETTVREWVKKAFDMWAAACQLTFSEIRNSSSDLELSFMPSVHGDMHPFDGAGGTLAHAFFPTNGQIHLEEAEDWTVESETGINLLFVLVHEIGHALGLGHSKVDQAIMEPVYIGYRPNLKLEKDDIEGIQFLYGKPTAKAPTTILNTIQPSSTTLKPTLPPRKFPCPFRFWAAMTDGDMTYGFFSTYIYNIHRDGRISGRKSIKSIFPEGPRIVGAAAYNELSGKTFLFIGERVWRFTDRKLDEGFPKSIKFIIRAAVVVADQLIGFSFTHIHYLDQDTMKDFVDGEVTINDEYPGLPNSIGGAVSYGHGLAQLLYTTKSIQVDVFTGEILDEITCPAEK